MSEERYIDPTAVIIGDVSIGKGVSVWPYAVLRGDQNGIEVGEGSNIQEHVMVHVDPGSPASIGKDVSVGHGAIIHGATIGDRCIVGIHSTVLNGAKVGEDSIIGANALVTEGMEVPPGSIVVGVPGKVVKRDQGSTRKATERNAAAYHKLRDEFIEGRHRRHRVH
ncbi:MAG: gamma carbonic anhydrase family protein [Methanomassiliicoccales archaeon]